MDKRQEDKSKRLLRLYPTAKQRRIFKHCKKYATQLLPTWTKSVPFQIKGNAIKRGLTILSMNCITKQLIFSTIILPTFETKDMVNKNNRKIRSKTVRAMIGLSFYTFRKRLEWIALKKGCCVVMNTEEYTSKTHPQTGVVNRKLGSAKTIKLTDGSRACRDVVGAYNFMLKTLVVDTPTFD